MPLDKKIYEIHILAFSEQFSSKNSFIKIEYPKTIAYLYEKDNVIWAFSVSKDEPEL